MSFRSQILNLETAIWDGILGINTLGCTHKLFSQGTLNGDAHPFHSKCFYHTNNIIRQTHMSENDVFYDIGCGSGRMVCIAALGKLKKCVGVEFSDELTELARRNAANLRFRKSPIEVIRADACEVDYTDGTIFALFNPFGAKTLATVLERIRLSVIRSPRKIRFIYMHPVERLVFEKASWIKQTGAYRSPGSVADVNYYENNEDMI